MATSLLFCFNKFVKACLCGDTRKTNRRSWKWRCFFSKRVRFARADEDIALSLSVKHRHQRMWRVYLRLRFAGG